MHVRLPFLFCIVAALLPSPMARGAGPTDAVDFDADGRVRALTDWPREAPFRGELWIVGRDWKSIVRQDAFASPQRTPEHGMTGDGGFARSGDALVDGQRLHIDETAGPSRLSYRCTSDANFQLAGVYWFASVPIDRYAGGSVEVGATKIALNKASVPTAQQLGKATGDRVTIRTADGQVVVQLTLDAAHELRVQDASSFGEAAFQIYFPLSEGDVPAAHADSVAIDFKTTIAPDPSDVAITIDATHALGDFDGFGGNFVYGIDSPTTRVALDALKLTWARVPLELREWEPINDNGDPTLANAAALATNDTLGSKLRKRFELDRELFKRTDGRMIASIWYLPEWLFAQPVTNNWRETAGIVPRERWDELAECITSYLLRLKDGYGVEPRLLSFNESDVGVYVKLDGQSMRDLTKLLASRFEHAGLKTKLLLGDSASVAGGLEQIAPTLADADARRFVGGLAYHPWAGENASWPAWADAAEKFGLPLFTTELGADSDAWRDGSFNSPRYTLRLAKRYVDQLSIARSRALLEWEWSDDFSMTTTAPDGKPALSPRGEWLRQLTQHTPQFGKLIATHCDQVNARAATLIKGDAWAIHLVNLDAARQFKITGLPATVHAMTLSVVDPAIGPLADRSIELTDGQCHFELPHAALATLSTPSPRE